MSSLSIGVIGVGGIGSTFAYHLARAGHEVTVVARPGSQRLKQLERDHGIVRTSGERAEAKVVDRLDAQAEFDLVLVTTLAHQVDDVLPALTRSKAKAIQFMFNTFDPERLQTALGAQRCSFGMPFVSATIDSQGKLDAKLNPGQKTLHGDERWVRLFSEAGLPSAFEPNMLLWLRCHVPMCIAFESISVAGMRRSGGASWAESMVVARGMRGGFAIIKGLGFRIYPSAKSVFSACPLVLIACMLWAISRVRSFRELLANGAKECRALVDVLLEAAAQAKPALPAAIASVQAMRPAGEH